jgi:hypothetical protein
MSECVRACVEKLLIWCHGYQFSPRDDSILTDGINTCFVSMIIGFSCVQVLSVCVV